MKLYIAGQAISLNSTKVMGVIDVYEDDTRTLDDYVDLAAQMLESGSDLIEVGLVEKGEANEALQEQKLLPIIEKLSKSLPVYLAASTQFPAMMEKAVKAGAYMIVDPNALRTEGALETIARLKVPVCLIFDNKIEIDMQSKDDPMSAVSEFLYERMDACLNAGISRKQIILDPSVGLNNPHEARLKLLGRLSTFQSFALPLSVCVPRVFPHEDTFMAENLSVSIAVALFYHSSGVHIIRTKNVREIVLALDTWDAAVKSSEPFRLSKAIAKRFLHKRSTN